MGGVNDTSDKRVNYLMASSVQNHPLHIISPGYILTRELRMISQYPGNILLQRFSGFLQQKSVERKAKTVERHTIIAQFARRANDDTPTRKQH